MNKINRRQFVRRSMYTAMGTAIVPALGAHAQDAHVAGPRLRVAQIGTAHAHAAGKIQALRALPEWYEVVAMAETDSTRRRTMAGREAYAGLQWMEVDALMEMKDLNVLVIETSCEEAPELVRLALEAGKHVHLDKPGSWDHAGFIAIRRLAEELGLIVQMGYMLRHLPVIEFLFRIVRDGWLGDLLEIEASMGRRAGDRELHELARIPGGGMFEIGCHQIDLVVNVLGKPQAVHASSAPSPDGIAGP